MLYATAAQHPNTLPVLANNPTIVGAVVIIALLLAFAKQSWKPVAILGGLLLLAMMASAGGTGGH